MASLAGAWIAVVEGFGGMRHRRSGFSFAPRLPQELDGLRFRVATSGAVVEVAADHEQAKYSLIRGDELQLEHHGETLTLRGDKPASRPIPVARPGPTPKQPHGRAPLDVKDIG